MVENDQPVIYHSFQTHKSRRFGRLSRVPWASQPIRAQTLKKHTQAGFKSDVSDLDAVWHWLQCTAM